MWYDEKLQNSYWVITAVVWRYFTPWRCRLFSRSGVNVRSRTCWLRCLYQRPTPSGRLRSYPRQQEEGWTWSGPSTPPTTCPPASAKPAARTSTGRASLPVKAPPRYPAASSKPRPGYLSSVSHLSPCCFCSQLRPRPHQDPTDQSQIPWPSPERLDGPISSCSEPE